MLNLEYYHHYLVCINSSSKQHCSLNSKRNYNIFSDVYAVVLNFKSQHWRKFFYNNRESRRPHQRFFPLILESDLDDKTSLGLARTRMGSFSAKRRDLPSLHNLIYIWRLCHTISSGYWSQ